MNAAPASGAPPAPAPPPFTLRRYLFRHARAFALGAIFLLTTTALAMAIPALTREAIHAIEQGDRAALWRAVWLAAAAAAVAMCTRVAARVAIFYAGRDIEYEIRTDLFARLLRHPPRFFAVRSTGDILNKSINDLQNVRALLGPGFLNIVNTPVIFAAGIAAMLAIEWRLTLVALLPYPIMTLLMGRVVRRLHTATRAAQEALDRLSSTVQETLGGIGVVHGFVREGHRHGLFARLADEYFTAQRRYATALAAMTPFSGGIHATGVFVVLLLGGKFVIDGVLTLGDFVAFNGYLALLAWPALAFGWVIALWQRGMASLRRIGELYDEEPAIVDNALDPAAPAAAAMVRGALAIRHLTYEYPPLKAGDAAHVALADVSFDVPAGHTVAILGRTGSGKSTLVSLLTRAIDTPPGEIFLDGVDVTKIPMGVLRSAVRLAPQEAFLFGRSVRDNIAFAPATPSDAAVADAARAAAVDGEIDALPDGYETLIGERGVTLSGGQRQRVALARLIAARPKVLVLDDTLSALDTETETRVLANLRRVVAGATALIVSHRVGPAMLADEIVVLEAGRVVERGHHDELLARGGYYARLYERQRLAEALEALET